MSRQRHYDVPLNQNKFLRCHALHILPFMARVELDAECFSISIGVFQCTRHEIFPRVDASEIAER